VAPARNRVTPPADIEAIALRGAWMGHRPCAECRRESYTPRSWAAGLGVEVPSAKAMNHRLHDERIVRGTHRRRGHDLRWPELPDGAFVLLDESPLLVLGDDLVEWTHAGYGARRPRPARGVARVITPPATIASLRAGYPVQINCAAEGRDLSAARG